MALSHHTLFLIIFGFAGLAVYSAGFFDSQEFSAVTGATVAPSNAPTHNECFAANECPDQVTQTCRKRIPNQHRDGSPIPIEQRQFAEGRSEFLSCMPKVYDGGPCWYDHDCRTNKCQNNHCGAVAPRKPLSAFQQQFPFGSRCRMTKATGGAEYGNLIFVQEPNAKPGVSNAQEFVYADAANKYHYEQEKLPPHPVESHTYTFEVARSVEGAFATIWNYPYNSAGYKGTCRAYFYSSTSTLRDECSAKKEERGARGRTKTRTLAMTWDYSCEPCQNDPNQPEYYCFKDGSQTS